MLCSPPSRCDGDTSEQRPHPETDLFGSKRVNYGVEERRDAGGQRQTQHTLVWIDQAGVEAEGENG